MAGIGKRKKQTQLAASPSVEYWAAVAEEPVDFIERAAGTVIRPENDLGAVALGNRENCRLFKYPDAALSIVVLIRFGQDAPAETVMTAPYVRGEKPLDATVLEVLPYDGNNEALVKADWNGIPLEFYVQKYFLDSAAYVPGIERRIKLSALAITIEEGDSEKLKLRPRGNGVYEIAGRIERAGRFEFFERRFFLFLIDVYDEKNDRKLLLPVCAAEHRIQGKAPKKGHYVTGMIWLQGALEEAPFHGAMDALKARSGEKRWKTPFGFVSYAKESGYRWYSGSFDEPSGRNLVITGPLTLENGNGILEPDAERRTYPVSRQDFESLRKDLPYFRKAKAFHMEILTERWIDFGPLAEPVSGEHREEPVKPMGLPGKPLADKARVKLPARKPKPEKRKPDKKIPEKKATDKRKLGKQKPDTRSPETQKKGEPPQKVGKFIRLGRKPKPGADEG
jgi:hypothetical protein